ncbi:MAG: hypothetical protein SFU56_10285 [Capsulimonadales bacterium]|nr:hypothetical protein [Capsulimonadales bacterium]
MAPGRFRSVSFTSLAVCSIALMSLSVARAQNPPPSSLPIAVPNGAKINTEFDGRENDLLGMVKDLINGMTTTDGKTGAETASGPTPLDLLFGPGGSDRLATLLRNVRHLHLVVYSLPENAESGEIKEVSDDAPAFYERAFRAEGGRRLFYNAGQDAVLIVGFDQPQGIAVVIRQRDKVTVARTVGYPDMKVVGGVIRRFTGASVPVETAVPTTRPASRTRPAGSATGRKTKPKP